MEAFFFLAKNMVLNELRAWGQGKKEEGKKGGREGERDRCRGREEENYLTRDRRDEVTR